MGADKQQAGSVQLWDRLRLWLELVQQVRSRLSLLCLGGVGFP
jgi:hypothetical protein